MVQPFYNLWLRWVGCLCLSWFFLKSFLISVELSFWLWGSGGIRPITVGEVLRRLTFKCILRAISRDASDILSPSSWGWSAFGLWGHRSYHEMHAKWFHYPSRIKVFFLWISPTHSIVVTMPRCSRKWVLESINGCLDGVVLWCSISLTFILPYLNEFLRCPAKRPFRPFGFCFSTPSKSGKDQAGDP